VRTIDFGGDEQQIIIPKSKLPVTKLELAELEIEEWVRDECIKQGLLQQACVKHLLARARKSDCNELPRASLLHTHTSLAASGGGGARFAGVGGHAASASSVLQACGKARKCCGCIHS
jgi:hypothetical protein